MDSRDQRDMTENGFNITLSEAVHEGLFILGENARHLIYNILEKVYQVRREQIPEKPEALHKALEDSLGSQAKSVERLIVKELYSRIGLRFKGCEGWTLAECVNFAKKHNESNDRILLSGLLTQIRYLRDAVNTPKPSLPQSSNEAYVPQEHRGADPSIRQKAKPTIKDVIVEMVKAKGLDPDKVLAKEFLAEPDRIYAPSNERESFEIRALSKALLQSLKKELFDAQNLRNPR